MLRYIIFAEDVLLIADVLHQVMTNELAVAFREVVHLNKSRTNFMKNLVTSGTMKFGKYIIARSCAISITWSRHTNRQINQTQEIQSRICLGWAAYIKLRDVFNSDVLMSLKRKL